MCIFASSFDSTVCLRLPLFLNLQGKMRCYGIAPLGLKVIQLEISILHLGDLNIDQINYIYQHQK